MSVSRRLTNCPPDLFEHELMQNFAVRLSAVYSRSPIIVDLWARSLLVRKLQHSHYADLDLMASWETRMTLAAA